MPPKELRLVSTADQPAQDTRPVLDLRLKSFSIGDDVILGGIDLQVSRGETLALVGPSGIGKSTLLRILAGLETSYQGTCDVRGQSAIMFQEPALLPWRNLLQNIVITSKISTDQAMQSLVDVGLGDRAADFPAQLSLGQQRRLSLARALAVKPDLLLLDEPFVSLDPRLAHEMKELFDRLRATHRMATVLVTHVPEEARELADRIVTLGGSPAVLSTTP